MIFWALSTSSSSFFSSSSVIISTTGFSRLVYVFIFCCFKVPLLFSISTYKRSNNNLLCVPRECNKFVDVQQHLDHSAIVCGKYKESTVIQIKRQSYIADHFVLQNKIKLNGKSFFLQEKVLRWRELLTLPLPTGYESWRWSWWSKWNIILRTAAIGNANNWQVFFSCSRKWRSWNDDEMMCSSLPFHGGVVDISSWICILS